MPKTQPGSGSFIVFPAGKSEGDQAVRGWAKPAWAWHHDTQAAHQGAGDLILLQARYSLILSPSFSTVPSTTPISFLAMAMSCLASLPRALRPVATFL